MPELPEVESTRRSLRPRIGARVSRVDLRRAQIVDGPRTPEALLAGSTILGLHRHGKQLAIEGERAVVLVHLGMTGQLVIASTPPQPDRHIHAVWSLVGVRETPVASLWFRDPRRFGGLWTFASMSVLRQRWARLGPDALGVPDDALPDALAGSRRAIKAVLLDQAVLAGVGNIYADEALFRAGIRPTKPAARLTLAQSNCLTESLRQILAESIESGGSTLRDYRDAAGQAGSFQSRHRVYGRGGEPCLVCGTRLTRTTIAQRTTVYCRRCQR
jgi:formamidopyrimidine-DNA glycosylase